MAGKLTPGLDVFNSFLNMKNNYTLSSIIRHIFQI
jgi:hypothetical protein